MKLQRTIGQNIVRLIGILFLSQLFGCTATEEWVRVTVRPKNLETERAPQLKAFDCYLVTVTADDIISSLKPNGLLTDSALSCLNYGTTSTLVSYSTLISDGVSLMVVAGRTRKIRVLGVADSGQAECGTTKFNELSFVVPALQVHEIASTETDILKGTDVLLTPTYNSNTSADLLRSCLSAVVINTGGLKLYLDASLADSGKIPAEGCSLTSWGDSSSSSNHATLSRFSSCGASLGWLGNGTASNPSRLALDATSPNQGSRFITAKGGSELKPADGLSVEMWIKGSSTANQHLLALTDTDGKVAYALKNSGGLAFMVRNDTDTETLTSKASAGSVFNNKWHHIVGTYDSSELKLYLDGSVVGSVAHSQPLQYSALTHRLYVGSDTQETAEGFVGEIGLTAVYATALSEDRVRENCKLLQARFPGAGC